MTAQEIFDADVLDLAGRGVDTMYKTVAYRRQGDPYARQLEEEYMMLRNVLDALSDYDVDSDVLDADDIKYLNELGELCVAASHSTGSAITYTNTDFDDWFLPSKDELVLMQSVCGITFDTWSSSESDATQAWSIDINGALLRDKTSALYVRACRSFINSNVYELGAEGQAGGLVFSSVDNGDGTFTYLEAAPSFTSASKTWSNITNAAVTGTSTAVGTGQANSDLIVAQGSHTTSAASICLAVEVDI